MSSILSKMVASYAQKQTPNADAGDLYEATKLLEKEIVDEICRDQAIRIQEEAKRKIEAAKIDRETKSLSTLAWQSVALALLVGLLGSHLYEMARIMIYGSDDLLNMPFITVATIILIVAVLSLILFLWLKGLKKALDEFNRVNRG